jgi:hypothetical protein
MLQAKAGVSSIPREAYSVPPRVQASGTGFQVSDLNFKREMFQSTAIFKILLKQTDVIKLI